MQDSPPRPDVDVGYDVMQRPATLQDSRGIYVVQGVAFNAAGQPVQTQYNTSSNPSQSLPYWENRG